MGLADRDYLRVGPRSSSGMGRLALLSFNSWLIIVNVAVFLIDPILGGVYRQPVVVQMNLQPGHSGNLVITDPPRPLPRAGAVYTQVYADARTGQPVGQRYVQVMNPLQAWGHFSTAKAFVAYTGGTSLLGLEVWRFISFQFLHGGLLHLVFNMLGLWMFGGMVEQQLGRRRYAAFYLMCGLCGALAYLVLNFAGSILGARVPGVLTGDPHMPLVGASAGVFGVIVACAKIAPNDIVQLLFPPVSLRLKVMAYGYVGIAALNLLLGGQNAGGDAAHLGGAIAGYFFIRRVHLLREFLDVFGGEGRERRPGPAGAPDRAEVDRILAKVAATGLGSLSSREKRVLQRASEAERARSAG